jgi:hypothetical protein
MTELATLIAEKLRFEPRIKKWYLAKVNSQFSLGMAPLRFASGIIKTGENKEVAEALHVAVYFVQPYPS